MRPTPSQKLSDFIANVGLRLRKDFLTKVTGFDAEAAFDAAKKRLVDPAQRLARAAAPRHAP